MNKTPLKRTSNGRIECSASFTKEQIEPAEKEALKHLGETISVPGFRAGHVPEDMVRQKISQQDLLEETIRHLLPDTVQKLVEEHDIKPIIHPHVELKTIDPLTLSIIFIEKPVITVKKADRITVEKKEPAIGEKEIQKMVEYILDKHKKTTAVDRAAKDGDRITMDFWGEDESKKEVEGTRTQGHQVVIGSKVLIPGFEENLKGLKKSDTKSFTLTFPEKYHAEVLQGKPVTFHVTVNEVEEITMPEITDEFAQKELGAANAADFREQIKTSMLQQEMQLEMQRRERSLLEEIRKATSVELAPELIAEETRNIITEFRRQLERQGMTIEDWLKQTGKKVEEFTKEMEDQASKRLTLRFGIEKLIEEKNVQIPDEEMDQAVTELLSRAPDNDRDQIANAYAKGENAYEQLKWQKRVDQMLSAMLS